ncbi:PleD family two-component system response regulator [Candidatus Cyanaurora vandensis]|uniref:response regulator n=1 Tax=Candidatus Cyanaurora vandensis TaxID=2714958 RepID=UPI00257C5D5A|nr:response regulator [Candidatus Cyanaurora vandensis]
MTMTGQRHKVLVIDDSFMVRKSLTEQLSGNRFEVFEAKDGPTGLEQAVRINPDVILLDFVMPGMNGYEVYQALRQQPQFVNTPVIVISSSREEVLKKFGQPFVGFDFLPKQFTREQLEERIDAVLPMAVSFAAPPLPAFDMQSVYGALLLRLEQLEARLRPELAQMRQRLGELSVTSASTSAPELLERLTRLEQAMIRSDRTDEVLAPLVRLENRPAPNFALLLDGIEVRLGLPELLARLSNLETKLTGLDRSGMATGANEEVLNRLQVLMNRPEATAEVLIRLTNLEQFLSHPPLDRTDEVLERLRSADPNLLSRLGGVEERLGRLDWAPMLARLDTLSFNLDLIKARPDAVVNLNPVLDRLEKLEERVAAGASTSGGSGFLPWGILGVGVLNVILALVLR